MSLIKDIKWEIRVFEEQIQLLEYKRSRAEAAIINAVIEKEEPSAEDVEFFRIMTAEIDIKRSHIQKLSAQLELISKA